MTKCILILSAVLFAAGVVLNLAPVAALLSFVARSISVSGSETAAWVQAVGSIVAIFATGIIAAIQHRHAIQTIQVEDRRRQAEREEYRSKIAGALLSEMVAAANRICVVHQAMKNGSRIGDSAYLRPMSIVQFNSYLMPERRILASFGSSVAVISEEALLEALLFDASLQNFNLTMSQVGMEGGTDNSINAERCARIAEAIQIMAQPFRKSIMQMAAEASESQRQIATYVCSKLDGIASRSSVDPLP